MEETVKDKKEKKNNLLIIRKKHDSLRGWQKNVT